MKIAVITDLHANREALQAVLDHAGSQGAERHAFVGDFVGYGADPVWVIDKVRELVQGGAWAVLGNHDAAVAQGPAPNMRPDARHVVEWTMAQLNPAQRDFLVQLPMTQEHGELLFVHANATDPAAWGYVHDRTEAALSMMATAQRITFCGHMHEPRLFHLSALGKAGDFLPVPGVAIPLLGSRRWLVIPGAAGQPRDGDPAAAYALYDDTCAELTYWRVPYDTERAAAKVRAANLPPALARRLIDGR